MNSSLYELLKIREAQLTGRTVQLLPLQVDHVDALWKAGSDPQIWQWLPYPMNSRDDRQKVGRGALQHGEQGTEFPFAGVEGGGNEIVGTTRYNRKSTRLNSITC